MSVERDAEMAIVDTTARHAEVLGHQDIAASKPALAGSDPAPASLIICALAIGIFLGALAPAVDQRGVDGALALAGIVNYPPQSPLAAYFLDSWTSVHQFGAILLRAGIDQSRVNAAMFLFPCALLVCGYAMIIYGLTGRFLLALAAAPLCYLANPLASLFASPDYTTLGLLLSQASDNTFGFWAHAGAVWVIGCVAGGRYALAGFSALALVCAHPVMGAYMTTLLAATLIVARVLFGLDMPHLAKGAAYGACVTLVSFAAHYMTRSGFSAAVDQGTYETYLRVWDVHRSQPMTIYQAGRIAAAAVVAVAGLSTFIAFNISRRNSAVLACVLVLLTVIASTAAYYAVHLAPEFLPSFVLRAAPGRLLNVQAFVSTPLTLAIAITVAGRTLEAGHRAVFAWSARAMSIAALLLVVVSAASYVMVRRRAAVDYARTMLQTRILGQVSSTQQEREIFRRNVRSARLTGLVLTSPTASTASIYYGHLPIALYANAFDFIPYLPQTADAVARIIQEGYGVSFSDPPFDMRHSARLAPEAGKTYWAQLSPDSWCRISRDLGLAALVAPSNWTVNLAVLVKGPEFTLYALSCI